MSDAKTYDVSKLIDEQPIRRFHVILALILFLLMIADGYDLQVMGFAAPGISKMLHMKASMLAPVFSASLVGMLVGAPLFGWIGDRFGRRPALLLGVTIFGVVSLLTAMAQSQPQLLVLRFLIGIGLGGVPPNSIALCAEYAPKRVRVTMIVLAQTGITFGSMMPAVASGVLEGAYGWRPLFLVGGIAPLLIAAVGLFALPESLKFMIVKKWPADKVRRVASALDPRLADPGAALVVPEPQFKGAKGAGRASLFGDGLMKITLIIWLLYIAFYAANYFMHSWMPYVFRAEKLSIHQTAFAAGMFDFGGIFGALVLSRLVDRFGVAPVVGFFAVACPAIGLVGVIGNSVYLLAATIFVAGFCLVGITLSVGAIAGVIYPTEIRANGIGWANGIGRFTAILSPFIGGWLIDMKTPVAQLFLAPVVPMVIGTGCCFVLMRLCIRRFNGPRLIAV